VCFPVYDPQLKSELIEILSLQVADTLQAVRIDSDLNNIPVTSDKPLRSQEAICNLITQHQE
jgi:polyphosphate kinase